MCEPVRIRDIRLVRPADRAITLSASKDVAPDGVSQSSGSAPNGTKRVRSWLSMDVAEVPPTPHQLEEKEIYMALRDYALEKRAVFNGGMGSVLKSWDAQEAVNCQEMSQKLAATLESAEIIPFYAEYLDCDRTPATGFAMGDVCLLYDPLTSPLRNGRIMHPVTRNASLNIYIYIEGANSEDMRIVSCARGKIPGEHHSR